MKHGGGRMMCNQLKRWLVTIGLVLMISIMAACGQTSEGQEKESYVPKELTVQFVPSQNADTLEAKPLEKLLQDEWGIPVNISVSTDYNTIIEAMYSKKVDVVFLPPTA